MTEQTFAPSMFRVTTPGGAKADYRTYEDALKAAKPISQGGRTQIAVWDSGFVALLGTESWEDEKLVYRSAGFLSFV